MLASQIPIVHWYQSSDIVQYMGWYLILTQVQCKDKANNNSFCRDTGLISEYHWWINWSFCSSRSAMMDLNDELDSGLDKNMHYYWLWWWGGGGVITLFCPETKMNNWWANKYCDWNICSFENICECEFVSNHLEYLS